MKIEPARPADRAAVVALWQATGLTRPWNDAEADFDLAMATTTSTVLMVRHGEKVIGTVMVGFDGHRGWVYYLACDPDARNMGVGRALMQAAEDWLNELGCPKIQLMVRRDNEAAKGFYSAIGYELQDVETIGKRLDVRS